MIRRTMGSFEPIVVNRAVVDGVQSSLVTVVGPWAVRTKSRWLVPSPSPTCAGGQARLDAKRVAGVIRPCVQ
jgi:hypothetical protein